VNYQFPTITHVDQVRAAVAGRDEFIEADRGDHLIFNYLVNFEDTFPPVTGPHREDGYDEEAAILRECRGLIFDKETGEVIARRYHKFFNLGEKAETRHESIDFTRPHVFLEKLDGSMITPFMTSKGVLRIGTKMGDTDVAKNAKKFIDENQNYMNFILDLIDDGYTPIFEWCSRKNRIVVDYPVDRLVLTGIRKNVFGWYVPYEKMVDEAWPYDVEVVQAYDIPYEEAVASLTEIVDEGYVVRFDDGHMLKMKGSHYLQLHKTLEHIQHEKDLIRLVVDEKLDDAKPFLPADLVEKLDDFSKKFFHNVRHYAGVLAWDVIEDYDRSKSKKDYAARVRGNDETKVRFQAYDFIDGFEGEAWNELPGFLGDFVYSKLIERIKNNLSTGTKVDSVRHLFGGIRWET
jgi:RNA ligase